MRHVGNRQAWRRIHRGVAAASLKGKRQRDRQQPNDAHVGSFVATLSELPLGCCQSKPAELLYGVVPATGSVAMFSKFGHTVSRLISEMRSALVCGGSWATAVPY